MKTLLCFLCLSPAGWACLFLGIFRTRRFRRRAEAESVRAEGVITGYETKLQSWGRGAAARAYYPVVCFSVDSREYRETSDFCFLESRGQTSVRPPEGSGVTLYYNPANPFRFRLEQDRNEEGRGLIRIGLYCIGFAAVASVVCAALLKW